MSSKRPTGLGGFTLIEMIIAIVIIGVGLAGVLAAYSTTVKSSGDPLIHKQMLSVAEEMMEEVLLKPYASGTGTISGCNRSAADDINDYIGYSQAVCDIDGNAVAGLTGYTVAVAVTTVTWQGIANTLRVSVTVSRGSDSMNLVSYRTDYAS